MTTALVRATAHRSDERRRFPPQPVGSIAGRHQPVLAVAEHRVGGGLGTTVVEVNAKAHFGAFVHKHGFYDEFPTVGPLTDHYPSYGRDSARIAELASRLAAAPGGRAGKRRSTEGQTTVPRLLSTS